MSEAGRLDVRRILEVLDRYRVDYVLVGGLAAAAHGATRATYDLDCCPDYTGDNLDRLAAAMVELDARLRVEGLGEDERLSFPIDRHSLARLEVSTWRTDAGDLDILIGIPDLSGRIVRYEELATRAEHLELLGVGVAAVSLDDLVASKEWAGRPKDHEALPELRRLRSRLT